MIFPTSLNRIFLKVLLSAIALNLSYEGLAQVVDNIIPDSLKNSSYGDLKELFYSELARDGDPKAIANAYKNIAIRKADSNQIARAFGLLARINEPSENLKLTDSILKYSTDPNDVYYPGVGYSLKGYWHYQLGNFQEALDNYLMAYKSAEVKGNVQQQIDVSQVIAALKNRWGDYEGAAVLYKKHLQYLAKLSSDNYDDQSDYLRTLYNLSLSYQHQNKIDSSTISINQGLERAREIGDSLSISDFEHIQAVNYYLGGDYEKSRRNFLKFQKKEIDTFKLILTNYYLGTISESEGDGEKALGYFLQVDTLYNLHKEVFPELRSTYEYLVGHFRNSNNPVEELSYIRKLISVDSLLSLNREYINKTIAKRYEVPELVKQKEELILLLNKKNKKRGFFNIGLSVGLVLLILSTFYYFKRNEINKRRFLDFQSNRKSASQPLVVDHKTIITTEIENILSQKLDSFELEHQFTDENLTLFKLAKRFGSNSTYLSRVINDTKNKNFSYYLSELRINLILKRLDEEDRLKLYTIQALGEEVGFKNGEAFSKAFIKITGIKPSFYLKQLRSGIED